MIAIAVIATVTIGGIGFLILYEPPPPGIGIIDNQLTQNETEITSEPTNATLPEPDETPEITNTTDTSSETSEHTDELNATEPTPIPDSEIITMNVSELYDLYIDAYVRHYGEAEDKMENLTGKVIRVRGVFRVSAREKAEDNETYELVILFGTDDESNPKDIFIYLPFTEEVLQAVTSIKYPDVVVVQGEFYPGVPDPLPFYPNTIRYSIVARLKNCQLVP